MAEKNKGRYIAQSATPYRTSHVERDKVRQAINIMLISCLYSVCMVKFAHFEHVAPTKLTDIYLRHGEVAREIHQDALRKFTGNDELTVDLRTLSPEFPDE